MFNALAFDAPAFADPTEPMVVSDTWGCWDNVYNKKIPNNDIIQFFKSNKLNKEYCFGLDGYKFKIKSVNFSKGYIIYNIKYTENKKNKSKIKLSFLNELIGEGLSRTTTSGVPILFKIIKKKRFV